jgi:MFS family permease
LTELIGDTRLHQPEPRHLNILSRGKGLSQSQRNRALLSLILSTTIALTGQFLISPILVFELNARGFSASQIGLFNAASWLGILSTTPFAAGISARLGARPTLIVSLMIPITGLSGILLSDSVTVWLILYFFVGFGSALRWVVGEALIASLAPPAWRGRIVGTFQMLLGAAFVAAPSLLAWLGPTNPVAAWTSMAMLVSGLALTLLMPRIDRSMDAEPGVGLKLLGRLARQSPLVLLAGFAGGFFELGISSVLPVFGMAIGMSASMAALLIAVSGLGSALAMLPAGMAADRFGGHGPLLTCALILLISSLLVPFAVGEPRVAWLMTLLWGGAGGALYTLTMIRIGQRHQGNALIGTTSLLVLSYTSGGLVGPVLSGFAIDWSVQWAPAAIYLLISGAVLMAIKRQGTA